MSDTFPVDPQAPVPARLEPQIDHHVGRVFPIKPGDRRPVTNVMNVCLPTHGRLEREHLYLWIVGEEGYVAGKFDDQRQGHDQSLVDDGLSREGFWFRQITQYLDRARIAFEAAADFRKAAADCSMTDSSQLARRRKLERDARFQEMKGQQALAKCMMTAKGSVESSIRMFGPMPKPGLSSGNVEIWE